MSFFNNSFFRFCLVGVLGTTTNLIVFSISTYILNNIFIASVFAFMIAVSQNFFLNSAWSFKSRTNGKKDLITYIKYILVNIFGLIVNLVTLYTLVNLINLLPILAQFLGIILGMIFNYVGSHFFVFINKKI